MTISYFDIFSRFHSKVQDYDLLELLPSDVYEKEREWLISALSLSDVLRLFDSMARDDIVAELDCELKYPIDDLTDKDFVENILAIGMVLSWTQVRLRSSLNINQMYGGKEEKFYSQAAHIAELRSVNHEALKELKREIQERGFFNNTYLDGE